MKEIMNIELKLDTKKAIKKIKKLHERLDDIYNYNLTLKDCIFDLIILIFIGFYIWQGISNRTTIIGIFNLNYAILFLVLFQKQLRKIF